MKRRLEYEQRKGISYINACELCRKPIKLDASGDLTHFVLIDHEKYEFVTDTEATERGDAVSLFPVGPDCMRRIKHALKKD